MDELEKNKIEEEISKIIQERQKDINENYTKIRYIYQNEYGWPEIDPLRYEICLCLMFDLNQAAILLTIHFVESLLKFALIEYDGLKKMSDSIPSEGSPLKAHSKLFEEGNKKYGEMKLHSTIESAYSLNLIDAGQKEFLHAFRVNVRNAFLHSDKEKTFGSSTIQVQALQFNEPEIRIHSTETELIKSNPIFQGYMQAVLAKKNALPNFIEMDRIARGIITRVFPD